MRRRFLLPVLLLGLAWIQELFDQLLFGGSWNLPMGPGLPLWGVLTAPFSHSGFSHLLSNSVVFLPLSWLVLTRGLKGYVAVWIGVLLVDVPIALFWPNPSHGLSGVVYGLLGYLLLIGWLERRILPIFLGLFAFWLYGSALVALIPGVSAAGVSWMGHAGGFLGGLLAALAVHQDPINADSDQRQL
jgi:membrane associated rhomboid family serine protease